MTLGPQLREWRRRRFLTQKDLAARLGVVWQSVARWEAEDSVPRPAAQRRLIEELGIDPDEFYIALKATEEARSKIAA